MWLKNTDYIQIATLQTPWLVTVRTVNGHMAEHCLTDGLEVTQIAEGWSASWMNDGGQEGAFDIFDFPPAEIINKDLEQVDAT